MTRKDFLELKSNKIKFNIKTPCSKIKFLISNIEIIINLPLSVLHNNLEIKLGIKKMVNLTLGMTWKMENLSDASYQQVELELVQFSRNLKYLLPVTTLTKPNILLPVTNVLRVTIKIIRQHRGQYHRQDKDQTKCCTTYHKEMN